MAKGIEEIKRTRSDQGSEEKNTVLFSLLKILCDIDFFWVFSLYKGIESLSSTYFMVPVHKEYFPLCRYRLNISEPCRPPQGNIFFRGKKNRVAVLEKLSPVFNNATFLYRRPTTTCAAATTIKEDGPGKNIRHGWTCIVRLFSPLPRNERMARVPCLTD